MKETVTVSIASQAFTIDKDAYRILGNYLENIRTRIAADDNDTMSDVENRIAEIFREKLPSAMMVVSAAIVRETMAQLGTPDDFGTNIGTGTASDNAYASPNKGGDCDVPVRIAYWQAYAADWPNISDSTRDWYGS